MRERFPFSTTKRLGLFHSDGTITVYAPDVGIEQAHREAVDFDENQDDPDLFTTIVSLRVEDIEALEVPSLKTAPRDSVKRQPHRSRDLCPPNTDVTVSDI
jgi:hypothetical protein